MSLASAPKYLVLRNALWRLSDLDAVRRRQDVLLPLVLVPVVRAIPLVNRRLLMSRLWSRLLGTCGTPIPRA